MRTSLVVLLTGLALTASSGCSAVSQLSGPDYKGTDLANDVVTAINRNAKQNGLGRKVGATFADCEDVETVEKDAIADCTVTGKDGKNYYVRVTFQDSKGHFIVNAV